MANVFDYLKWRGALSFLQSPFNEVDNLIFSKLSCVCLTGIVPAPMQVGFITIRDAARKYFNGHDNEKIHLGLLVPDDIIPLFQKASECGRFCNLMLTNYINIVDERSEKQFSALTVDVGDGTKYIAFRGTDDTIIGWKENFNISILPSVSAQEDAVTYLHTVSGSGPEVLRVGGHSKGGNLAVYAAVYGPPEIQDRIVEVYNNDGPGFGKSILKQEKYQRIRGKIRTIVPQSSVVGMLLEHEEGYEVVKSRRIGPLQHDAFNWEVSGSGFVHLTSITAGCRYFDRTIRLLFKESVQLSRLRD